MLFSHLKKRKYHEAFPSETHFYTISIQVGESSENQQNMEKKFSEKMLNSHSKISILFEDVSLEHFYSPSDSFVP